ncbi:MAG: hypothetical protein MPK62_00935 [Alphaproteobacteria bacterium]|nr:hypothetical protein [Alphaproteobacteria bacterium]MDA8029699.1 hypothetical protein [Alphaproteobacteria bacterium]
MADPARSGAGPYVWPVYELADDSRLADMLKERTDIDIVSAASDKDGNYRVSYVISVKITGGNTLTIQGTIAGYISNKLREPVDFIAHKLRKEAARSAQIMGARHL